MTPLANIDGPFVLLDDGAATARLYRDPMALITAFDSSEIRPAMAALSRAAEVGLHAAGYLSYEAGFAFEEKLSRLAQPAQQHGEPLLWFGLFGEPDIIATHCLNAAVDGGSVSIGDLHPDISRPDYARAFAEAARLIGSGDIYQVNLTFPCRVPLSGHPLSIYAAVRAQARARHGGIVRCGPRWILSFSPELFFELKAGMLTCRPMKGTARRLPDPIEDARTALRLAADPKQRAENLMIVDLLRNDMARIAVPGSVRVDRLFEVETYPTIHQLTSTIRAKAIEPVSPEILFAALFPCGSITGAPKVRAMEVIAELEQAPRGIYTGTIGAIAPNGDASFNVAIRTLDMNEGDGFARLGLGSGLVADSQVDEEWAECLTKARFLSGLRAAPASARFPRANRAA